MISNWITYITTYLPIAIRQSSMVQFCAVLLSPAQESNEQLGAYISNTRLRSAATWQVLWLQKLLTDELGATITITEGDGLPVDFHVTGIPFAQRNRAMALINRYKLAGRSYIIEYTDLSNSATWGAFFCEVTTDHGTTATWGNFGCEQQSEAVSASWGGYGCERELNTASVMFTLGTHGGDYSGTLKVEVKESEAWVQVFSESVNCPFGSGNDAIEFTENLAQGEYRITFTFTSCSSGTPVVATGNLYYTGPEGILEPVEVNSPHSMEVDVIAGELYFISLVVVPHPS